MTKELVSTIRNGYLKRSGDSAFRLLPVAALGYLVYASTTEQLFRWTAWQSIGCILLALLAPLTLPGLVENLQGLLRPEKSRLVRRLADPQDPIVALKRINVHRPGSQVLLRIELELQFKSRKRFRLISDLSPHEVDGPTVRQARLQMERVSQELRGGSVADLVLPGAGGSASSAAHG
jgi:hypothetical protein